MANETVLFKRGDSATITSTPVTDGQILFDTSGNGKMYLDNGTTRLTMGGAVTIDSTLSKTSTNAIQNKAVTGNILNSLAEVSAATQQNTIAGALALKEVNSKLAGGKIKFGIDDNGNYGYIKDGADTVTPFNSGSSIYLITQITVPKFTTSIISKENLYINNDYIKIDLTNNRISILKDIPNAILLSRAYYSAIYKNGIMLQDCTGRNGKPIAAQYPENYIQTKLQAGDYLEVYSGDSSGLTHVICIYSFVKI